MFNPKIKEFKVNFSKGVGFKGGTIDLVDFVALLSEPHMIIFQGISGAGKTTIAEYLKSTYLAAYSITIASADNFFTSPKRVYNFNPKLLEAAHELCFLTCLQAFHHECHSVIVDNTHCDAARARRYLELGHEFKRRVIVMPVLRDPATCFAQSTHALSENAHKNQLDMFENHGRIFGADNIIKVTNIG